MNVCIIGNGLTSLSLAKNLINKKINVHIYHENKIPKLTSSRTIGISKNNLEFFKKNHVPAKIFKDYLEKNKWVYQTNGKDAGPAINYINPEFKGKFGLIAPYSKDFCKTCNRLRITARGDLRLCLFGNTGTSIRHLLQSDDQKEELVDLVISQLRLKKASHHLELGDTGITPNLSSTGG